MVPTIQGLVAMLVGLLLLGRPPAAMLCYALFISIFGSASALDLPALGGSSIQPGHLALGLLGLRLLCSRAGRLDRIAAAFARNGFFVAYCLYGAVTAF